MIRLGVQLYTFRNHIKDLESFKRVLDFVNEIGGKSVQISGLKGLDMTQIAALLKSAGLIAAATHSPFAKIKDDLDRLVDQHLMLGCRTIGIGMMPMQYVKQGRDGIKRFVDFVNETAQKLKGSQVFLHYHNHAREFKGKVGQRIMDIFDAEFDKDVKFSFDAFWAHVAKCQPMAELDRFCDRIELIHIKDSKKFLFFDRIVTPGDGVIDYPQLLKQADKYCVGDALIELDYASNAFCAVKKGMQYLYNQLDL